MPTERSGGALVFRADCHREVAENGWDEPCKSRGLRTVLWAAGGEIPPADPASIDKFGYASLRSEEVTGGTKMKARITVDSRTNAPPRPWKIVVPGPSGTTASP